VLVIDNLKIENGLVLAPLAGISDIPFRLICRSLGAGLVFSEMISASGLVHGNASTRAISATIPEDHPVVMQLFGSEPELMGEAAAILSTHDINAIDINMGCPVKKVVCRGAGSALLRDLELAERIIRAVVGNSTLPVTVKIRTGWDSDSIVAVETALMAEASGASCVTVHGRTSRQLFGGKVDRNVIRAVKEAVSIPVIGNGDVASLEGIALMRAETGCDGVMIGRAALGNPWIFSPAGAPSSNAERMETAFRHFSLMEKYLSPHGALVSARINAGWYVKGIPGCSQLRKQLFAVRNVDEVRDLMRRFFHITA